ncbi:hypothetical protein IW140_001850 [Coemansia sp. RSA 1813]|nr:hypothetical protein EV178_002518 [Coemansia sp. RSA 1646]KAJ1772410.1 hypothetical protein LPJ74_001500 [Coemansia sp. RSA 1843]KAJ2213615.1 hypothetical protein EV179_003731 [Coemansia sp. RSA 487]KAJ2571147.1 hypothetical protein IW140_001850 [Coemansia sp. RSA 1813]
MTSKPGILVSAPWVHDNLSKVKVFDCSWYLPFMGRNSKEEFINAHVPGARFFDIDEIKDQTKGDLPHMLPQREFFGATMDRFGINNNDHVVVYDSAGVGPACRVFWTFQAMGHSNVSVLNGGFPEWAVCKYKTEAGDNTPPALKPDNTASKKAQYTAHPIDRLVCDYTQVVGNIEKLKASGGAEGLQIVDARPRGRFTGKEPEFRSGLSSGHMPYAISVPSTEVTESPDPKNPQVQMLKSPEKIRKLFSDAGVDLHHPIITTCGSGVTASVLYFALLHAGVSQCNLVVYDGSWTEYALNPHSEIVKD